MLSDLTNAIEKELKKGRDLNVFHHPYEIEQAFFEAVKQGSHEKLKEAAKNLQYLRFVRLAKDELRHQKNTLLVIVTLVSRAMIAGKVPSEEVMIANDLMLRIIEKSEDIKNPFELQRSIFEYAVDRVHRERKSNTSPEIFDVKEFVQKNIYHTINVNLIAENLHINPSNLSSKFKKEMNISLTSYIQKQKIEQATYLITHSDYSFSDIYTLLNFSDQSHFIRVFKKHTGMSPKEYKYKK